MKMTYINTFIHATCLVLKFFNWLQLSKSCLTFLPLYTQWFLKNTHDKITLQNTPLLLFKTPPLTSPHHFKTLSKHLPMGQFLISYVRNYWNSKEPFEWLVHIILVLPGDKHVVLKWNLQRLLTFFGHFQAQCLSL